MLETGAESQRYLLCERNDSQGSLRISRQRSIVVVRMMSPEDEPKQALIHSPSLQWNVGAAIALHLLQH